jgi:hypothetical protein
MDGPRSCNDCGASVGEPHGDDCDVATCLVTGRQRLSCSVGTVVFGWPEKHPHDDCGNQAWAGEWPGHAECEEFGWWAVESPATQKWMRDNGIPDGDLPHHNLNRLAVDAGWDPVACRFRRPNDPVDDTFYVRWHLDRGLSLEPSAHYTLEGVKLPAAVLLARIGRAS